MFALAGLGLFGAEAPHRTLLAEAAAAQKAGDLIRLVGKLEEARAIRPDYPRGLLMLARGYVANHREADAMAILRELAAMGMSLHLEEDKVLACLQAQAGFAELQQAFRANGAPHGRIEREFRLPEQSGIIEGLGRDAHGNWYFGDVRQRGLWRREPEGTLQRFSNPEDRLLGVFGLRVNDAAGVIWAGTAATPEMEGYAAADKGHSALVCFDLATGRVRQTYPVPADSRDHLLGDVYLAADGSVFATDSNAPIVWRLAPGADRLERWLESEDFVNLQGMTASADGHSLIVADYLSGLWQVSLADKSHRLLPAPSGTTLFGIDGLYAVPGGLVATQNGTDPLRVIHLTLDQAGQPTQLRVLASGQANANDISLGTVAGDRLFFVGNSGWALFESPTVKPAPRSVHIIEVRIPAPSSAPPSR